MPVVNRPTPDRDPWSQVGCDRRVAVVIDNTLIPVTFVEQTISQGGAADVVSLVEVKFPAEWDGKSVLSEIDQFDPNTQRYYSIGEVYFQDPLSETWFIVHKGFVRGVGSTNRTGEAKLWIDDPASLTNGVPFSQSYKSPSVNDVFEDVRTAFTRETVFSDVKLRARGNTDEEVPEDFDIARYVLVGMGGEFVDTNLDIFADKTFKNNRHSCSDALSWVTEKVGGSWYFRVDADGTLVLTFDENIEQQTFVSEEVNQNGTPIKLIENNALAELSPYNSVTVHGSAASSIFGHNVKELQTENYPVGEARIPALIERTGQEIRAPIFDSEATTMKEAEKVARKKLIELQQTTGEGDLHMYGRPEIFIGDKITARPICPEEMTGGNSSIPIDYQVESITHTKEAKKEFKTRVNVSVFVDRDDIEVSSYSANT